MTTLRQKKSKVTFHIVPSYLEQPVYLANMRQAAIDGHEIGIFMQGIDEKTPTGDFSTLLKKGKDYIKSVLDIDVVHIRLPVTAMRQDFIAEAEAQKCVVSGFNLDSMDYSKEMQTGNDSIFQHFKKHLDQIAPPAKGDFIAVMRDPIYPSVQQSGAILDYVRQKGYDIVTLDECFGNGMYKSINKKSQKALDPTKLTEDDDKSDSSSLVNAIWAVTLCIAIAAGFSF